jgi:chemotaxis signal transduction protein
LHRHVELDKGLTNLRDEIISVVDKALYLFTFN